MEAKDYVVNEVLRDPRRFMVPIYQRKYQWGEAELTPFWHDVVAKADEALSGELRFQHYMGALILAPGGDGYQVGVTPRIQVVDGQQRLTTFQLFLAALREVAMRRGVEEISANVRSYLFNQPMVGDADPLARYKLSPTPADRTLVHEILDLPADDLRARYPEYYFQNGNARLGGVPSTLAAYHRFMWWIDGFARFGLPSDQERDVGEEADGDADPALAARRLHALQQALLGHMKLVVISLGEGDDAQVIFETLNSKGKPLLAMDLVRNNIFHRAEAQGEAAEKLYDRLWTTFEGDFWEQVGPGARPARPRIDHFLSHALTAQTGSATSVRELYAEYRAFARPKGKPRFEQVEAELLALTRYAPTYRTLEGETDVGSALFWFGRKLASWEVTTDPVAFEVAEAGLAEEEARALYRLVYSYVVRRAICGLTAKNLNGVFQRIASRFLRDGPSLATFVETFAEQSGPAVRFPTDDELRFGLVHNPLYKWFNKGERLQDVLWELEVASRGPYAEAIARPSSLWIEHVMPQTWQTHWPLEGSSGTNGMPSPEEARRERLIHTIGNLTLTTDRLNIALGNGMFETKRAALDASLLALNKWFTSRGDWNEVAIEERSGELAERAITIWPHPSAASTLVA